MQSGLQRHQAVKWLRPQQKAQKCPCYRAKQGLSQFMPPGSWFSHVLFQILMLLWVWVEHPDSPSDYILRSPGRLLSLEHLHISNRAAQDAP